jgi:acyl-CoA synthetase (AMP-forming)/AMP-acid ligase II
MLEIIDKNFLPSNIKFFDSDKLITKNYQNFEDDITYWKTILYEGYDIRPGHSIALYDKSIRYSYCTLFLAAAELGVKLIIIPEYPTCESGRTDTMDAYIEKYGKVDLCILDEQALRSKPLLALTKYYGKLTISKNVFDDYEIKDHEIYTLLKTTIFAKPDDILTVSTTSGSTGVPKLIPYTHQQLYRNAVRNTKVYGFKPSDRACHTRNMHHPFVLTDFFMPSLNIIENHFQFVAPALESETDGNAEKFVKFIRDNKINQIAFSSRPAMEQAMKYMIDNGIKFDHEFNMILGGQYVPKKYLQYVKDTNATKIIAVIGTTETLSPLMLKHITPNDDIDRYEENYLGKPPDSTYEFQLNGESLSVCCPELYPEPIVLEDKFKGDIVNGFYHLGRDNFYRIDHVNFKMPDVVNIVKKVFDGEFDVCFDPHYQNLYLAVWSDQIDFESVNMLIYQTLEIKFKDFAYLNKIEYNTGFKLNQQQLRKYFREKNL